MEKIRWVSVNEIVRVVNIKGKTLVMTNEEAHGIVDTSAPGTILRQIWSQSKKWGNSFSASCPPAHGPYWLWPDDGGDSTHAEAKVVLALVQPAWGWWRWSQASHQWWGLLDLPGFSSPTILLLWCLVSLMELLHDLDAECFRGSGGGRHMIPSPLPPILSGQVPGDLPARA